jgi:hypothetical protein
MLIVVVLPVSERVSKRDREAMSDLRHCDPTVRRSTTEGEGGRVNPGCLSRRRGVTWLGYMSKEISLTAIWESKVFLRPWIETVGWPRMEALTGSLGIGFFLNSSSSIRPTGRTASRSIGETT